MGVLRIIELIGTLHYYIYRYHYFVANTKLWGMFLTHITKSHYSMSLTTDGENND